MQEVKVMPLNLGPTLLWPTGNEETFKNVVRAFTFC